MKDEKFVLVSDFSLGSVPMMMTVEEYKQFLNDKADGLIDM